MNELNIYLDESGNSGGVLAHKNLREHFDNQPFFCLAGIGDIDNLEEIISSLRIKHNVPDGELKCSELFNRHFGFIEDIVKYLKDNCSPLFVELMDKRYFLFILIFENIIFHSNCFNSKNPEKMKEFIYAKKLMASHFYEIMSDKILSEFSHACEIYTQEQFEAFFMNFVNEIVSSNSLHKEGLLMHIKSTWDDYLERKKQNPPRPAFSYFLPLPDIGISKNVILSPHVNAFLNVLGRIQRYAKNKEYKKISIIHDQQDELILSLNDNLIQVKQLDKNTLKSMNVFKSADFDLDENIELNFKDSEGSLHIQISDIICGSVARIFKKIKEHKKEDKHIDLINSLIDYNKADGLGINMVIQNDEPIN